MIFILEKNTVFNVFLSSQFFDLAPNYSKWKHVEFSVDQCRRLM